MDFKSKASITLTAAPSAAEIREAVRNVPGAEEAILDVAQTAAEAAKAPTGLTLVTRSLTSADDGSIAVDLVYEKVDAITTAATDRVAAQAEQPAQEALPAAILPLTLHTPGAAPAAA